MTGENSAARREDLIFIAKLAEQAERYHEMKDTMKQMVAQDPILTAEERTLLSVAFKNVIGSKRVARRVLSCAEYKECTDSHHLSLVKSQHEQVNRELRQTCDEIGSLLDRSLIPTAVNNEVRVFYLKMKGYHRYHSEVGGADVKAQQEQALSAYSTAWELAKTELGARNPIRLGLALNFSVFYYEIMHDPQRSCSLAKEAFDDAIVELDTVCDEEEYKELTLILQLLRDNIHLWNPDGALECLFKAGAGKCEPSNVIA
eukprot:TRINITY_DN68099_c2_g4_i3.p1 TRINITY_DN68099_c2_g4~~TRINITY_DN68099_c2_g4_i3.p1  ORF type:complete len:259 (-),score=29.44 TRINITY_DN68099_c2_g4_i3:123-899(-)